MRRVLNYSLHYFLVSPVNHNVSKLSKGPFKCYVTQMGWGVSNLSRKSVTKSKVYGSTLLALRWGGWGSKFQEKYVT